MQWPGGRILQRHELDAFLAQAVSSQLYEPDQLQELKVRLCSPPSHKIQIHNTAVHSWRNCIYDFIFLVNKCVLHRSPPSAMEPLTLVRTTAHFGQLAEIVLFPEAAHI